VRHVEHTGRTVRVCILAETYPPEVGGGEAQARLLAEGLAESGCEVLVLTRRSNRQQPRTERTGRVSVLRLPPAGRGQFKKWGLTLPVLWVLSRRRRQYDVLLACPFRILGIAAVLVAERVGKPVVLKAETNGEMSGAFFLPGLRRWGLSDFTPGVRRFVEARNRVLRRAPAFVALSSAIRAELLDQGVVPERVHLIPNGVDTRRFRPPSPEERAELRGGLGIAPNAFVFVFAGRLVSYKGLPLLVRAWSDVYVRHDNARLMLVGGGGADIHACEAELRRLVAAGGLESAVTFAGEVTDVERYLKAADAFVFPTEREAFGIALVEAMACGLPVITTRTGGIVDIVTDEGDALVVSPGDGEQLVGAVERLLTDRPLSERLGRAARETALRKYACEPVVARYLELFQNLLSRHRGREGRS
jgi:glycosyltransferase involved in cell wall biosynthesis